MDNTLAKGSLINFILFLALFASVTMYLWPPYHNELTNAEMLNKIYEDSFGYKGDGILLPENFYKQILKPCKHHKKDKLIGFCREFEDPVMELLVYLHDKYNEVIKFESIKQLKQFYNQTTFSYRINYDPTETSSKLSFKFSKNSLKITSCSLPPSNSDLESVKSIISSYFQAISLLPQPHSIHPSQHTLNLILHQPPPNLPKSKINSHLAHLNSKLPYFSTLNVQIDFADTALHTLQRPGHSYTSFHILYSSTLSAYSLSTNQGSYTYTVPIPSTQTGIENDEKILQTTLDAISYLYMKHTGIITRAALIEQQEQVGIEVELDTDMWPNEIELWNDKVRTEKIKFGLKHVHCMTLIGQGTDQQGGLRQVEAKMNQWAEMDWPTLMKIEDYEQPVPRELYEQTEFPYLFSFAMFFTFYAPLVIRMISTLFNYAKLKIKSARS